MRLAVKVPLLLAIVVITFTVGFAVAVHLVVQDLTQESARDQALQELHVADRALTLTGSLPPGAVLNDPAIPAQLAATAKKGTTATLRVDSPPVMWAAERTSQGEVLAVQTSWAGWRDLTNGVDRSLGIAVGAMTMITAAGAVITGRRMTRRLRAAETAAERITAGDLDARVADAVSGKDEIASLGRTIDTLSASMRERLEVEKRVTADIAHDLRTPVTALVTASELLPPEDPMSALVRGQVRRLWQLVEDLLEVARLDQTAQSIEVVETDTLTLARAGAEAMPTDLGVEVFGSGENVLTDPRRVQRVLVNLLGNAQNHGRAPITITCDARSIAVADRGDGFPPELLTGGPQRFRTGSASRNAGNGLGLTIAAGQARVLGGSLRLENPATGGARVVLELPAVAPGRHD